jgi:DNA replication protein DnaC
MTMEAGSIAQHCKTLRLFSIGGQFASLAEEACKQNHSHLHYLEALLQGEVEDRERRSIELRLKDAHLPRMKTLEEFDFAQSPHIPAARIRALAEGGYLQRAEPVLLVGEPGTGKTHLATGLAIAACRQRKRVRFTTAAALVNQLVEAQRDQSLTRMLKRWASVELIVIDELGYVPLAEVAAELLFQVIAERAEKAAVIVTTNLPFSECHRSSPTHVCVRPCSTGSPTRLTSSRPALSHTASAEPWERNEKCSPPEASPFGSASASPYGLRSSRTEHYPRNLNVPRGGPEQTAEVGQTNLPKATAAKVTISALPRY